MLILARLPGESIMISDEVTITVVAIKGKRVQIGIEAPKRIAVHREEIYKQIIEARDTDNSVVLLNELS